MFQAKCKKCSGKSFWRVRRGKLGAKIVAMNLNQESEELTYPSINAKDF